MPQAVIEQYDWWHPTVASWGSQSPPWWDWGMVSSVPWPADLDYCNLRDLPLACKCLKWAAAECNDVYQTKWILNMTMNYTADQLMNPVKMIMWRCGNMVMLLVVKTLYNMSPLIGECDTVFCYGSTQRSSKLRSVNSNLRLSWTTREVNTSTKKWRWLTMLLPRSSEDWLCPK